MARQNGFSCCTGLFIWPSCSDLDTLVVHLNSKCQLVLGRLPALLQAILGCIIFPTVVKSHQELNQFKLIGGVTEVEKAALI